MPRRKRTSKRRAELDPLDRMNAPYRLPYEPDSEEEARRQAREWYVLRDELVDKVRQDPDHWSYHVLELGELPRERRTMDYDDPRAMDGDYAGGEVIPWTARDQRLMRVALEEYRGLRETD